MVRKIGKCTFKSDVYLFSDRERFSKTRRDCDRAGSNQASNAAVADRTGGYGVVSVQGEEIVRRRIREIAVADAVRSLVGTAIHEVEVAWVIVGTGDRRKVRAGLPETHRAD